MLTGNGVAGTAFKLTEGIKNTIRKVTNIEIDFIRENYLGAKVRKKRILYLIQNFQV
jgi:hypothetical protein